MDVSSMRREETSLPPIRRHFRITHMTSVTARAFETPADIEHLRILARRHAADFKELK